MIHNLREDAAKHDRMLTVGTRENELLRRWQGRYAVVSRQHGGKNGGKTCLTEKGRQLMYAFQQYENAVRDFAQQRFDTLFRETGLI